MCEKPSENMTNFMPPTSGFLILAEDGGTGSGLGATSLGEFAEKPCRGPGGRRWLTL